MLKYKQHILYITIIAILLSLITINNDSIVSALSYSSSVGVGFTFNPTLSVSLSSSDLIISNLTPGITSESNSTNISVATNSAYGYILTTSVGNSAIYNNTNLIHNNSNNIFSSISTNASLSSLDDSSDDNIWGYSYKLSSSNTWSNYSGLPLYSNPLKVLLNADSNDETNNAIDFKIAAKASSTQASGEYNNVINFSAVTKPTPTTLAEAYANYYSATNKTMYNGYYVMQDMADSHICENTEVIGSELQVIDIRDDKVYWIAKLADGKCWMTQNLDLDIDETRTYTHWDTDLGWSENNENGTWQPLERHSTINFTGIDIADWKANSAQPYSANPGEIYYYTSNSENDDIQYSSLQDCANAGHNDCQHYQAGNYYNWPAATANNDASVLATQYGEAPNSICPAGWKLPTTNNGNDFGKLLYYQNVITGLSSKTYTQNGFNIARIKPLYLVRAGGVFNSSITSPQHSGVYWSSTMRDAGTNIYDLWFNSTTINQLDNSFRHRGFSVRCLAR